MRAWSCFFLFRRDARVDAGQATPTRGAASIFADDRPIGRLSRSSGRKHARSNSRGCPSRPWPSTIYRSVLRRSRCAAVITCCTVDRETRNSFAIAARLRPASNAARISRSCAGVTGAALAADGLDTLLLGATVDCATVRGQRGSEVSRILAVDFFTASPRRRLPPACPATGPPGGANPLRRSAGQRARPRGARPALQRWIAGSTAPIPDRTGHGWQVARPQRPDQRVCEIFTRTPYISRLLKKGLDRNLLIEIFLPNFITTAIFTTW